MMGRYAGDRPDGPGWEVRGVFWVDLVTIPLFTALIGYVTNWTGVVMLFQPIAFHGRRLPGLRVLFPLLPRRVQVLPVIRYDGRIGWQGIVPSRADKMASIAVDKGLAKLGGIVEFYEQLEPDRIAEHLAAVAAPEIRGIVEQIMMRQNPRLWQDLPPAVREAVHARVQEKLPEVTRDLTDRIGANIEQLIDAKLMVVAHLSRHPELLNRIFSDIGRKELRFMRNFGLYAGGPLGVALFFLTQAFPYWWVLPLGGAVIGWTVNWLAVAMIFEPVRPQWWVPWRQGLFLKRQDEVTDGYAAIIAENVITLTNIGHELLHGPRADSTRRMLEDALLPTVDGIAGRASAAVRVAVGTREYDRIRSSVAREAARFAPRALSDAEFNRRQAAKINAFVAGRMRQMSPEDFVQMLRSAIKQDEWLLFLHGGVLGIVAGLLHLAIFGT